MHRGCDLCLDVFRVRSAPAGVPPGQKQGAPDPWNLLWLFARKAVRAQVPV